MQADRALTQLLATYAGQYDLCVLLSHLGINVDRQLAKRFPQLTVIIGSHTHHLLVHGEQQGQSLLAAAGKFGRYVGRIELEVGSDHRLLKGTAGVVTTEDLPVLPADMAEIANLEQMGHDILAEQRVAKIPATMEADPFGHPRIVQEGLHAIAEYAGTQAAMLNSGLFLHDLPRGVVTQDQLHTILPHSMHVMRVTLNGYDLWRLIQEAEQARLFLRHFPQRGMGFRGKVFGELNYLGIAYDPQTHQVTWRGEPVSPIRQYTLAVVDHYLFVPFFPTISIVGKNELFYHDLLREVFAQYLGRHYPLNTDRKGGRRWIVRNWRHSLPSNAKVENQLPKWYGGMKPT